MTALALTEVFDVSFDGGCLHCLNETQQLAYVAQLSRLLPPGGTHLIWAGWSAERPARVRVVERLFAPAFTLVSAEKSRRRIAASRWYWLRRQ